MPLKLGRLPRREDKRTLQFRRYFDLSAMPALEPAVDYTSIVIANGGYGMLANGPAPDNPANVKSGCGNCTFAGLLHLDQTMKANANGIFVPPTAAQAVADYSACTGFDPSQTDAQGNNPTDNGANLLDVLNYYRSKGVIGAYFAIHPGDIQAAKYTIQIGGGIYDAAALPDSVVNVPDLLSVQWDDTHTDAPNPENGHCPPSATFDGASRPSLTWATKLYTTWGFWTRYFDEAYAIFSNDWLNNLTRLSPPGIAADNILADLQSATA